MLELSFMVNSGFGNWSDSAKDIINSHMACWFLAICIDYITIIVADIASYCKASNTLKQAED
jgi:hypothetical protein